MATNVISVNVYGLNNQMFKTAPQRFGFPVQSSVFREVEGVVTATNGTRLYGIVQPLPTGLNVSQPQFYTVESVSQLVALANA